MNTDNDHSSFSLDPESRSADPQRRTPMKKWRLAICVVGLILAGTCLVAAYRGIQEKVRLSEESRRCAAHAMELSRILQAYAAQHDGVFPPSLDVLVDSGQLSSANLACPISQKRYAYVGGQVRDADSGITLLFFEQPGDHREAVCHVNGETTCLQGERFEFAIAFTQRKIAESDTRLAERCGLPLTRDDAYAWKVKTDDGQLLDLDDKQLSCLHEALKEFAAEDTLPRRCVAKWNEIADNNCKRLRPNGQPLFHLRNTQGEWRIVWRTTSGFPNAFGFTREEVTISLADFIRNLPESQRERATRFLDDEIEKAAQ